jgi:hypothetical protein
MARYSYDESKRVLDPDTPLVSDNDLTTICKEAEDEASVDERTMAIATAHAIVYEYLDGYGVPLTILDIVERYLSAHFICITYPQTVFESVGKLQQSFSMKVALGFDQTRFGQQAKKLDPTGQLKKLDDAKAPVPVSITWLGMTQTEKQVFRSKEA